MKCLRINPLALSGFGLALCLGALLMGPAGAAAQPANPEGEPVQFLFIHHSCGGQLLADPGPQVDLEAGSGDQCIYVSHPNGGGLRGALAAAGFAVNEASYGSVVGEDTDIHHWRHKFNTQMDRILSTRNQDKLLPDGVTNRVVAFKSCFPNNNFQGQGEGPGNPDDPHLTVANAQATYRSLLPLFKEHPDVLFVAFTAPPMAEPVPVGLKAKLKRLFAGKPKAAGYARTFNQWLAGAPEGWLAGYGLNNVVVFDHFGVLTNNGESEWSAYPTGGGGDSHPSQEGNRKAAEAFVPFIRQALAALPAGGSAQSP